MTSAPAPRPDVPWTPLTLASLPALPPLRLAVVGHVEVVSFVTVERLPEAGRIGHASDFHDHPAGGGAVVAVQMARLTGQRVPFFTALGRDHCGQEAAERLEALGLELHVAWRDAPTRRGITFVDASGERTITVIGARLAPQAADPLPWQQLAAMDGVFATATDAAGLTRARAARVLAVTPRLSLPVLRQAALRLDALIGSALDPDEQVEPGALDPEPGLVIGTAGAQGGHSTPGGRFAAPQRQRPVVDTYGAGDSFAAGVTAGLAAGWTTQQAISLGCHCGSACLDGPGPYAGQLRLG